MDLASALLEIEATEAVLEKACDELLGAVERGRGQLEHAPLNPTSLAEVFSEIATLCAFRDLAGQRLRRLAARLSGAPADDRPDADLMQGPANADGLDQAAADALFDER